MFSLIRCDNAIIPRFTVFANSGGRLFAESLRCGAMELEHGSFMEFWVVLWNAEDGKTLVYKARIALNCGDLPRRGSSR